VSEFEFEARRLEAKDESARRNFRPRLDRTRQDTTLGLCGDHRAVERTNRPRDSTVCRKGLIANGIDPHAQTRRGHVDERGVFPRRTRGIRVPAAKGRNQKREPEQTEKLVIHHSLDHGFLRARIVPVREPTRERERR
jgi:hypothetical protein